MLRTSPLADTTDLRAQFDAELHAIKDNHSRALYEKWIGQIGANGIIDVLNNGEYKGCHDVAHDLGKVIYDQTFDVGTTLRVCEDVCSSGCMHGTLMEFFGATDQQVDGITEADEHTTLDTVKERIHSICGAEDGTGGNAVMRENWRVGDCVHAVGHAVMFLANYDIPLAISYCDLLDSEQLSYYCATGAYMEYVVNHDTPSPVTVDGLMQPCAGADYPAACFHYRFPNALGTYYAAGGAFKDLVNACLTLSGNDQLGCFHGIGNGHYLPAVRGQATLGQLCAYGNHDDQYVCTEGLIERMGRYNPDKAVAQCDTVDAGWQRDLCLAAAGRGLYDPSKPFDLYQK